jgi:GT2 family glycosyltransferase
MMPKREQSNGSKIKILVAVAHIGTIRAELATFLLSFQKYDFDVKVFLSWGRPITANRNKILQKFREGGYDYLLQIDSDIEPPVNILEMINNNVDICSADIHISKGREVIRLALFQNEKGFYHDPKRIHEGLNEVDATGTGCLLLSKKAVEEVGDFQGDSEDFDYCLRAREKGFTIYYDTRFRCFHYQTFPL